MRGTTYGRFGEARTAPAGYGFSAYLANTRAGFGQVAEAPADAPSYEWPKMVVGRKVDLTNTGPAWREFHKKLTDRVHRIGRVLPMSNWMLVYYSHSQMKDMVAERYPRLTQQPDDGRRRKVAREVVHDINEIINRAARHQIETDARRCESPLLSLRKYDPENIELEMADREAAYDREDTMRDLWLPSRYEAGRQEGFGPRGFGIQLVDSDERLAEELHDLDVSIRTETGLDTRGIARERALVVQTVDTTPLPVRDLRLKFPGYPVALPLKAPHAYMD